MSGMTEPTGRREASKQATRAAIRVAAQQLFADSGFEQTTVRDIAQAANVTERTFYRYFETKEALLAQEYLSWLATLRDAIIARPPAESPLTAVRRAMTSVAGQARAAPGSAPAWPLGDRPFRGLRQSAPRPLLRFEESIASAIAARIAVASADDQQPDPMGDFRAQVIARVAVAAFRSATISQRERRARGDARIPTMEELLDTAFAIVSSP
jgi:AcrR family transcriptional regulator